MKFEITKRVPRDVGMVVLVKTPEELLRHELVKPLTTKDKSYLRSWSKQLVESDGGMSVATLPSGKHLFVFYAPKSLSWRKTILAMRQVITAAKKERVKNIAVTPTDFVSQGEKRSLEEVAEAMALQLELANFEFVVYKEKPKKGWPLVNRVYVISDKNSGLLAALERGRIIGEETNKTRTLSNMPGGDMTPRGLAEAAVAAGKSAGFKVTVLDEKGIAKLGMGGVLGVSRGSVEKPRFIVMEYMRGPRDEKPVVLVGKGVTFDTGGLNLKPEQGIYEMHMDMSGGAAVIHTIAALARLRTKKNIIGLVPAVENMPSGSSYRPGDVLKTMSGKTIEVKNTDAEGRIILADALTYAQRYTPRLVIDVATLTGAAVIALGERASAIFSTDQKISKVLQDTGETVYDFLWPLPLWEDYEEEIKGTFGDVSNIGSKDRVGGAITAAVFLWQFIKGFDWVHLDISPRMTSIEGEHLAKGAAGASVPLLARFLRDF